LAIITNTLQANPGIDESSQKKLYAHFVNPVDCSFVYKAKDLTAPLIHNNTQTPIKQNMVGK
jgi:hypothetical protein